MKKRVFRSMSLLAILAIVVTTLAISILIYREFYQSMEDEVRSEAAYLAAGVEGQGVDYLNRIQQQYGDTRLTWIAADGNVLFDSAAEEERLDNHLERPEVQQALRNGTGQEARLSSTMGQQNFYYAVRLADGTVLRVAKTVESVFGMMVSGIPYLAGIVLCAVLLSLILARRQTQRIIEPLNDLDLENPLEEESYEELAPLLHRISKQKHSIEEGMQALQDQKKEFQDITDHMKEGLLVLDNQGSVISMNASASQIFQVAGEDAVHHNVLRVSRNEILQRAVEKALGGENGEGLMALRGRIYQVLTTPIWTEGSLKGATLLLLDVTERQEAEQQRREFSANVSHELKTPLQSISGYAELLKNGMVSPGDIPRFSEKIYKEASRLMTLVQDIINLSQLDEGGGGAEKQPVELLALAQEISSRFQEIAEQKQVQLAVSGRPGTISGNRRILEEMISNLCDNAVKYNRPGGRVEIAVRPEKRSVLLSVTDTGIGIPEESQSRVFERFYRVDKSRSKETGGTGLGLSIVKHGAQYHQANLQLASELGKGTRITVRFPRGAHAAVDSAASAPPPFPGASPTS